MKPLLPSSYIKTPPLSKEETYELITAAQGGSVAAMQKIVTHSLGLIPNEAKIAFILNNASLEFNDLFQEGVTGIIESIKHFDVNLGLEFSTYTKWWIKERVGKYIKTHQNPIRMPLYAFEVLAKYAKVRQENTGENEEFWLSVVAAEKKIPVESIRWLLKNKPTVSSLDEKDDEKNDKKANVLYEIFNEQYYKQLDYKHLLRVINLLPERTQNILIQRSEGATLQLLADLYKTSRETIRQTELNAVLKIRTMLKITVDAPLKKRKG